MRLPGDDTQSSSLPSSKKADSFAQNSSGNSKALANADAEYSFFHKRPQRNPGEKSSLTQSTTKYPRVTANVDSDRSFFRSRPQHSSETEASSVGSPPSPISPLTTIAQQKAKKADRQRLVRSEDSWSIQVRPKDIASAPNLQPTVSEAVETKSPVVRPLPTSQASRSSYSPPLVPSPGAQISSDIPILRIPFNATKDGKPPREAKHGHKWHHELSGHWLEIRVGRNRRLDDQQPFSMEAAPGIRSTTSQFPLDHDPLPSGNEIPLVDRSPSAGSALTKSITISSQEGLYCRTKRRLGLKKGPINSAHLELLPKTWTGELLDEASEALQDFEQRKRLQEETSSIATTNTSIAGSRSGLSRLLPSYRRSAHSTSSSVRNLLMGNPPQPSPDPEAMYQGSDANNYFRTEIAGPDGLTFLPSEARRVGTPPLYFFMKRGFFFNYSEHLEERKSSPKTVRGSPMESPDGTLKKRKGSEIDWYKSKEAADEAKDEQVEFELNVPEHLPNSPLCPRNPKHKSGGKRVCVYHGRNRPTTLGDEMGSK